MTFKLTKLTHSLLYRLIVEASARIFNTTSNFIDSKIEPGLTSIERNPLDFDDDDERARKYFLDVHFPEDGAVAENLVNPYLSSLKIDESLRNVSFTQIG